MFSNSTAARSVEHSNDQEEPAGENDSPRGLSEKSFVAKLLHHAVPVSLRNLRTVAGKIAPKKGGVKVKRNAPWPPRYRLCVTVAGSLSFVHFDSLSKFDPVRESTHKNV